MLPFPDAKPAPESRKAGSIEKTLSRPRAQKEDQSNDWPDDLGLKLTAAEKQLPSAKNQPTGSSVQDDQRGRRRLFLSQAPEEVCE